MPGNEVTLSLEGEVTLEDFAKTMTNFMSLMNELSSNVAAAAHIDWIIEDLQTGSAMATALGVSEQEGAVQRVVRAYEVVWEALERGGPIPYSDEVAEKARAITQVIDGRISAIRFQTSEMDAVIHSALGEGKRKQLISAFGLIKGRVETLNRRKGLKFTLYDDIFDKPITCYIRPELEKSMLEFWGKRVTVAGVLSRDPVHGRVVSVRDISDISLVLEVEPESYKIARGVIPWSEG